MILSQGETPVYMSLVQYLEYHKADMADVTINDIEDLEKLIRVLGVKPQKQIHPIWGTIDRYPVAVYDWVFNF